MPATPPAGFLTRRQAAGIVAVFLLVLTGRAVRHWLLIGPEGRWRDEMWLDEIVLPETTAENDKPEEKPKLTTPLPINGCSVDSLCLLPGVGPVLAGRIDEVRRSGVVFRTAGDLKTVKGIGPALSAKLAPHVVFGIPETTASPPAVKRDTTTSRAVGRQRPDKEPRENGLEGNSP